MKIKKCSAIFSRVLRKLVRFARNYLNKNQFDNVNCDINAITIGPDVDFSFIIKSPSNLTIGDGTVLNGRLYINAEGGCRIGQYCHIAQGLVLLSSNHDWKSLDFIPYGPTNILKSVSIGDAVWIGANVTILPGATIQDGAILGAGAVVRGVVPRGAIMIGNPAVVVGYRDVKVFNELHDKGRFL